MRLSKFEQNTIKETFINIFGKNAEIFLFGSRVDDSKKGGDIDLYVVPMLQEDYEVLFDKKIKFLVALKNKIGEQKIDVIISKDKSMLIEQEALKWGIKL